MYKNNWTNAGLAPPNKNRYHKRHRYGGSSALVLVLRSTGQDRKVAAQLKFRGTEIPLELPPSKNRQGSFFVFGPRKTCAAHHFSL